MYHHLNTLTIFPDRLAHNFRVLSDVSAGVAVVPVVKSNAYGHGIKILAPILDTYDIPFVCVDSLYEAYELEKHGYSKDVLIMWYVDPSDIPRRRNFIYAISDLEYALALIKKYPRIRLHIFLDTGMHREGMQDIDSVFARSILTKIAPNIEWMMSHLSTPDNKSVTEIQLIAFQAFQKQLGTLGIIPKHIHVCASGGLINAATYKIPIGNIARTGIAYFGYGHSALQPALRCTTRLIQTKTLRKWDTVGYDGTYEAENTMKIGILPLWYHDGMDRRLSSIGYVSLRNTLCPIVGRVSMNLTTIDISHVAEVAVGDEVIIIDENADSPVSLERQAERAGMIPYDVLVHLNKEMFRTKI